MKKDCFGGPGQWYKGNLHSHTTNSDGRKMEKFSQVTEVFTRHRRWRCSASTATAFCA